MRSLFAVDVPGETRGRIPRHARVYDTFAAEYARLQDARVKAFSAVKTDVAGGQFPDPSDLVTLTPDEKAALSGFLSDPRRQDAA